MLLPENGVLVINSEITSYEEITKDIKCPVITFGLSENAEYTAQNISFDEYGFGMFELVHNGVPGGEIIHLNVPGRHNISNALSVIALSSFYGIPMETIKEGLAGFKGTERRFEKKGSFRGVTVIDDYAHHPTEIKATLTAAEAYPHKHLWCVFQPHTYSRTKALLKDFAEALSLAENVILTDIYAAREKDPGDISSKTLQEELKKSGKDAYYISDFEEIKKFLSEKCFDGDLLITMGAGNVVNIGEDLIEK